MFEQKTVDAAKIANDNLLKLPRFQRKKSWNNSKRFELCLSLFKEYPLGTIVIQKDLDEDGKPVSWLLDGRQRRDTLKDCQNPINIYLWAEEYLSLKSGMVPERVIELFEKAVEEFIEQDEGADENGSDKVSGAESIVQEAEQ